MNDVVHSRPQTQRHALPATTTAAKEGNPHVSRRSGYHRYPFYSPRFWHGMRLAPWWRLLRENHFRVQPSRWAMAVGISLACPVNEALTALQHVVYGRKLRTTPLAAPPLFVLGHWRSGTTLMHELLAMDSQWGSPSTYQCFAPNHFLVSEWFFRSFANWLLPSKRPMDNMATGWDRPQEDEFALMTLGVASPYRRIAFPKHPPTDLETLDWDGVAPQTEREWLAAFDRFLRAVTQRCQRPLVLKSPTHTGRIGLLRRTFPGAKFIHMTRDPRSLFPSTVRLWQGLDQIQALQLPEGDYLQQYVVDCLRRMYHGFHRDAAALPASQLIHVRYEDFVADPVQTLASIYDQLDLDHFRDLEPKLQNWVDTQHRQYQPNQHELPAETEALLRDQWKDYFQRYNYE